MGDWDFLYEMRERGYSSEEIMDAAACGYAPYEKPYDYSDEELNELFDKADNEAYAVSKNRKISDHSILIKREILEGVLDCSKRYFETTGRYLQFWGELGELYAEIEFGLVRHKKANQEGSDGFIGKDRVEVKTISPEKNTDSVIVKKQGDFQKLLIIKIDKDFNFKGKIFSRDQLKKFSTRHLKGKFSQS